MSFIQDGLVVCETISAEQNHQGKILVDRIVAMLTKMGGRSTSVKESEIAYYSGMTILVPIPMAIPIPIKSWTNK